MKKKAIEGMGWFVNTISGLASGDPSFIIRFNDVDLKEICRLLETTEAAGFPRVSRKGWTTLEHPVLGLIQWKSDGTLSGVDYFFLQVNGEKIIEAYPEVGAQITQAKWVAKRAKKLPDWQIEAVENFLGSIQHGTSLREESRNHFRERLGLEVV